MDVFDELTEALSEYQTAPGLESHQRAKAAIASYVLVLRPLVGEQMASRYDHAFSAFASAQERWSSLVAQYQRAGGLEDEADAAFLLELKKDVERTAAHFEDVSTEMVRVLDEKGGA